MKKQKEYIINVSVFCLFITTMLLMYIFLPKNDFSQLEKRYLKEFPEISVEKILSGDFGREIETYMADHMPLRDFFVGVNSYYELFIGQRHISDIYVTTENALVEAPININEISMTKNMNAINKFCENSNTTVDFMLIPSAGWASRNNISKPSNQYMDADNIEQIYSMCSPGINTIDVINTFDSPSLYYKTDHHWNSLGAYTGYKSYMETINKPYRNQDEFTIEVIPGFCGSTYSRAALWLTPPEKLELWECSKNIVVTNETDSQGHQGVFYRERLNETDKYTVFLDGNHSVVRIHNSDAKTDETILVVRDSYSNCFGGFLCETYENVILVDLRYYKKPVSDLCKTEKPDNILICYSLHNFLTDNNIIWLK